jgi:hypothetical protein
MFKSHRPCGKSGISGMSGMSEVDGRLNKFYPTNISDDRHTVNKRYHDLSLVETG